MVHGCQDKVFLIALLLDWVYAFVLAGCVQQLVDFLLRELQGSLLEKITEDLVFNQARWGSAGPPKNQTQILSGPYKANQL